MARLPTTGSDAGAWGALLSEYLTVEHNSDGTHKDIQVVVHGSTNSVTRPLNVTLVIWIGTVQPLNFIDGDLFIELT